MLNKQQTASLNNHLWRKRRRRFIRRHYEPVGRESVGSVCCVNDGNKLHINMRVFTGLTQEAVSSGWGQTNRDSVNAIHWNHWLLHTKTNTAFWSTSAEIWLFLRYTEVRTEIIGANWLKWEKTTTANLWKSCNLHWVTNGRKSNFSHMTWRKIRLFVPAVTQTIICPLKSICLYLRLM